MVLSGFGGKRLMKKPRSKKYRVPVKGSKHEKFVAGFFTQIMPASLGEIET
jgi:hypothetical protein